MSSSEKCDCNKERCSMNEMNWNRHINACQIRKAKRKHHNITSFFTASQTKKKCSTITAKSGRKYSIFIFIIRARNLVHFILPYYDNMM